MGSADCEVWLVREMHVHKDRALSGIGGQRNWSVNPSSAACWV